MIILACLNLNMIYLDHYMVKISPENENVRPKISEFLICWLICSCYIYFCNQFLVLDQIVRRYLDNEWLSTFLMFTGKMTILRRNFWWFLVSLCHVLSSLHATQPFFSKWDRAGKTCRHTWTSKWCAKIELGKVG